jgi:hypothetical protein
VRAYIDTLLLLPLLAFTVVSGGNHRVAQAKHRGPSVKYHSALHNRNNHGRRAFTRNAVHYSFGHVLLVSCESGKRVEGNHMSRCKACACLCLHHVHVRHTPRHAKIIHTSNEDIDSSCFLLSLPPFSCESTCMYGIIHSVVSRTHIHPLSVHVVIQAKVVSPHE